MNDQLCTHGMPFDRRCVFCEGHEPDLAEVKRYEPEASYIGTGEYVGDMRLVSDGEYVRYSDYAALQQDCARIASEAACNRLRAEKAEQEVETLRAEVKRLISANEHWHTRVRQMKNQLAQLQQHTGEVPGDQNKIYCAPVHLIGPTGKDVRVRFVSRLNLKDKPTEANPSPIRVMLVSDLQDIGGQASPHGETP